MLYNPRVCRPSPVASLSRDTVAGPFRTMSSQHFSLLIAGIPGNALCYSKKFLTRASQFSIDSCYHSLLPLDHHLVSRDREEIMVERNHS